MFKKILSATDLVESIDAPVTAAQVIAKQNSGKLYLLHVLESSSSQNRHLVKHFETGEEFESSPDYEQIVLETIRHRYMDQPDSYLNVEVKVATGYPYEEILSWGRAIGADLIVIGPHSSRAQEKGVVRVKGKVGSTAEGVIINQCCPVMVVNQHLAPDMLQFKKLVLAMDFSASCIHAFRFALKLARTCGSKIFAYNMLPVPPCSQYTQAMYDRDLKIAQNKLDAVSREIPPEIEAECKVWGGVHPHLEILKYAARKEADTIVMGSHTKDKNGKWYVGSAVERVSYRAACPVIVITDPATA
ncbi:MAG: universal stress protein [Desulfobacterales bacterium]|nr:MAG: universal stress protein [Desulfobacterales bacterium]